MDAAEQELFESTVRNATKDHTGQALDAALEDLGWQDAMRNEPRAAIATLFQLQGAHNATSSALGHVVRHALGLSDQSGSGIVLPAIGQWDPPGRVNGHGLHVNGLAPATLCDLESATVMVSTERGDVALVVPLASLTLDRVHGIDPHGGWLRVTGANIPTDTDLERTTADWNAAVTLSRLAVAHELVGSSRTMLELAREHALGRIQFARPISSFQAIRHRLAETLVAIEMAEALLDFAWLDGTANAAAMAKAAAGRQARTTARHCQQVLAGIGFTTEHPLHRYVQRTLLLDGLFGTAVALTKVLGQEIIDSSQLPPLLPL
jgi:alkylation response protein AidB-like acyl-CoA dehydrogenase